MQTKTITDNDPIVNINPYKPKEIEDYLASKSAQYKLDYLAKHAARSLLQGNTQKFIEAIAIQNQFIRENAEELIMENGHDRLIETVMSRTLD